MAKLNGYHCDKEAEIATLKTEMDGFKKLMTDNGHEGIPTVLHRIVNAMEAANKRKANAWKWVIPLAVFLSTLLVGVANDHYILKNAPDHYASKEYLLQVLTEFQQQTQILENATINNTEDIIELRKALNDNNEFLKRYTLTRGVAQKDTFTK